MSSIFSFLEHEGKRKRKGLYKVTASRMPVDGSWTAGRAQRRKFFSFRRFLSTSATRVNAVVKSKYVRSNTDSQRHLIQHFDYIHRANKAEREERPIFNRSRTDIERDEAIKAMSLGRGARVAFHKMILSPGDNSVNLYEYTRESMSEMQKHLGHEVDWVAIPHYNTDHQHAHVLIAGRVPSQERARIQELRDYGYHMQGRDVELYPYNLDRVREAGNDYLLRERSIDRELDLAIQREFGIDDWTRDPDASRTIRRDVWYQDRSHLRDLGLNTFKEDQALLKQLRLGTTSDDREVAKELGLNRLYHLNNPRILGSENREPMDSARTGIKQDRALESLHALRTEGTQRGLQYDTDRLLFETRSRRDDRDNESERGGAK